MSYRIWPSGDGAGVAADVTGYTLGTEFYVTGSGYQLEGYWWWCPTGGNTNAKAFRLYSVDAGGTSGSLVSGSSVTESGSETAGSWNYTALPTPVALTSGQHYRACVYWAGNGSDDWYGADQPWSSDITDGPVTAPSTANALGNIQGSFAVSSDAFPNQVYPTSGSGSAYYIDVSVAAADTSADAGAPASAASAPAPAAAIGAKAGAAA